MSNVTKAQLRVAIRQALEAQMRVAIRQAHNIEMQLERRLTDDEFRAVYSQVTVDKILEEVARGL